MQQAIEVLADQAVRDVLQFPLDEGFNKERFSAQATKANIGARYVRDKLTNERVMVGQAIRVAFAVVKDPEERKRWIKASAPKLIPLEKKAT